MRGSSRFRGAPVTGRSPRQGGNATYTGRHPRTRTGLGFPDYPPGGNPAREGGTAAPGHRGVAGNEVADVCARQAAGIPRENRVDRRNIVSMALLKRGRTEKAVVQWWEDIAVRDGNNRAFLAPRRGVERGVETGRSKPKPKIRKRLQGTPKAVAAFCQTAASLRERWGWAGSERQGQGPATRRFGSC